MGTLTIADLLGLVKDAGTLGVLILILTGGYLGWWVWGWQHRAALKELNEWKRLALSTTSLAETLAKLDGGRQP